MEKCNMSADEIMFFKTVADLNKLTGKKVKYIRPKPARSVSKIYWIQWKHDCCFQMVYDDSALRLYAIHIIIFHVLQIYWYKTFAFMLIVVDRHTQS